jgi:hypothetical protein
VYAELWSFSSFTKRHIFIYISTLLSRNDEEK